MAYREKKVTQKRIQSRFTNKDEKRSEMEDMAKKPSKMIQLSLFPIEVFA